MRLRAIIADDEPLSIEMIKVLLAESDCMIDVVATCSCGEETMACVAELKPDILFLDVNMPKLDGMVVATKLLRQEGQRPAIVFTTAHAEFAAMAFDVEAADYLLKPIQPARLARTLERVKNLQHSAPRGKTIPVPMLGGIELLSLDSVEWVEANRDYVTLYCNGRSYVLRKTLAAFATSAFPDLRQCHRSFLVNLQMVRKVAPKPRGEAVLCMNSGREIPVSRGFKAILGGLDRIQEK
jgi:DNA-binding LytR/AlgR family response regulator